MRDQIPKSVSALHCEVKPLQNVVYYGGSSLAIVNNSFGRVQCGITGVIMEGWEHKVGLVESYPSTQGPYPLILQDGAL